MDAPSFETAVSHSIPRRALLIMPLAFGGLMSFYPRTQRPNVPFQNEPGTGDEITIASFQPDGERASEVRLRKIVKSEADWKAALSPSEFAVTRKKGTERAFTGPYWKTSDAGLYRCCACGTALFRSQDKFDSGTGWPSFSAPAAEINVSLRKDYTLMVERTEVICARCDGHLGHVFKDGPPPTGLRYCINSAALRFEPSRNAG